MRNLSKATATLLATSGLVLAGAGVAAADTSAGAATKNNVGLFTGFVYQDVQNNPLNNCANYAPTALGLLSGTAGDACLTH